ncbi:MAG: thioredoxin fold domain-containing protein [Sedimenticolaceae bacterium]
MCRKHAFRWLPISLLILFVPVLVAAPDGWNPDPLQPTVYPDWFVDSLLDLQDDLHSAKAAGKQGLMVVFSMPYCSFCKELARTTFADPAVSKALQRDFAAVHLDLFSDVEVVTPSGETMSAKAFASREGADYTPAIYFYGLDGQRLLRIVGYHPPQRFEQILRYLSDREFERMALREYLVGDTTANEKSANDAPVQDPLFAAPPFALDRRQPPAQRPLMIVFDRRNCRECSFVLGELFRIPSIRSQLEQFDLVRLDFEDQQPLHDPIGRQTTTAKWHANLGFHRFPAFAFLDEYGNLVQKTDAMMLEGRLDNTLGYVLERAYLEGINYQRFASRRAAERFAEIRSQ